MAEPLKNTYNKHYIDTLANSIARAHPAFDKKGFCRSVFSDGWKDKELKQRMSHITGMLHRYIDLPYAKALDVLQQAAPGFSGYEAMFFPDYVEQYGMDHWQESIKALAYLTRFSSSEFAVRPFIEADPDKMLKVMKQWANDDNEHVRRLASEGCRPRLPWARQLTLFRENPEPILPILKKLQTDESLYVRKSVANNLNDISKDHPQLVLTWAEAFLGEHHHSDWVIRKGLRTLLKKPDPRALELFGYTDVAHIQVKDFSLSSNKIRIGDTLCFDCRLSSKEALGKVRVEYAIDYMRANGRHNQKVFMLVDKQFDDTSQSLQGQQSFREMSTRRHYPGEHRIYLRVNGIYKASQIFELVK